MREKKDIFNGKIKKEYFSYILVYMIFLVVLFVGVGVLCICVSIWGATSNPLGERILIAALGVISFMLGPIYLFLELLVIRQFPKYEKLRRVLFNSDCYFTQSDSKEYYGRNRRREKAAFALVAMFAEAEKAMGNKKSVKYKTYSVLIILMCVLSGASLAVMIILGANKAVLPEWLKNDLLLCFIFISIAGICIAFAVFFLRCAYEAALMAPFENDKWKYALYTSLVDISVRRNKKKHKFWYETTQLNEIEELVIAANEYAELKLERKGDKLVFSVIDTLNDHIVFKGIFM